MRHLFIALMTLCALCLQAQVIDDIYGGPEPQPTSREMKEHQKALQRQVDSVGHTRAIIALERGYWVLLADRINVGFTGYTVSGLNGNTNFVFQQAQSGMVQFAFNHGAPGLNGMGGMTLEGRVSHVQQKTDKKGNIRYGFSLVGEDINAQVDVTVYAGSDYAQAIVTPAFSGPVLTVNGRLMPYIRPRK